MKRGRCAFRSLPFDGSAFGSAFLPPLGCVRTPKDIFQALSFANELQALADIRHFSFVGANLLKTLILLSVTRNAFFGDANAGERSAVIYSIIESLPSPRCRAI
jgi:hypothetical protein